MVEKVLVRTVGSVCLRCVLSSPGESELSATAVVGTTVSQADVGIRDLLTLFPSKMIPKKFWYSVSFSSLGKGHYIEPHIAKLR